MEFQVFEVKCTTYLLKDIPFQQVMEKITAFLDKCLSENRDKKFLDFHKREGFKNYSFDSFFPLEKEKVYRKEKIYSFRVRMVDPELADFLVNELNRTRTEEMQGVDTSLRIIEKRKIQTLSAVTPVILKTEKGYWKNSLSMKEFNERIKINLIKKYKQWIREQVGEEIKESESFELFSSLVFKTKTPYKVNYKGIVVLGDKIEIVIEGNEMAQNLAYFAVAAGLGEMNARGCGFVNYRTY